MVRRVRKVVLSTLVVWFAAAGLAQADRVVVCESQDEKHRWCPTDTRGGVTLDEQISDSLCVYNVTWGYDRRGIWVDKGCRARFRVGDWTDAGSVTCESENERYRLCPADTTGGVALVEQLSDSPCRPNVTWGYDQRGIWVDNGCRARFKVGGWGGKQTVKCESEDLRHRRCPVNTAGGVTLVEHLSDSPCRFNDTWGYDGTGIWVDGGCRAVFRIGQGSSGWHTDDEAVSLCRQAITDKVLKGVDRRAAVEFGVVDARVSGDRTYVEGKGTVRVRNSADPIGYTCTVDTRKNRVTDSRWNREYGYR